MKVLMSLLALTLITACNGKRSSLVFEDRSIPTQIPTGTEEPASSLFSKVKTEVLAQCTTCHKGIDNEANLQKWIVAGDPDASKLFKRTEDGSMPMGGEPLGTDKLELIREYIIGLKPEEESRITFTEIKAKILEPNRCLQCHKGMADEANLVKRWVNKTNLEQSKFITRVQDGTMPKGGPALTGADQQLIMDYLETFR